jgi:dihydrofolate reductase
MAKLIYSYLASLDGYIADQTGNFDWAAPDDEVHAFVNDLVRPIGTYLYGRRMYETMTAWETDPDLADHSPTTRDFAQIWRSADKIVYSSMLQQVSTSKTRIEPTFDPGSIHRMKASAEADLAVGGANLAGQAILAGLVDEVQLFVAPVVVGGGTPLFPNAARLRLELLDERRFGNGMVYLRYRTA